MRMVQSGVSKLWPVNQLLVPVDSFIRTVMLICLHNGYGCSATKAELSSCDWKLQLFTIY